MIPTWRGWGPPQRVRRIVIHDLWGIETHHSAEWRWSLPHLVRLGMGAQAAALRVTLGISTRAEETATLTGGDLETGHPTKPHPLRSHPTIVPLWRAYREAPAGSERRAAFQTLRVAWNRLRSGPQSVRLDGLTSDPCVLSFGTKPCGVPDV